MRWPWVGVVLVVGVVSACGDDATGTDAGFDAGEPPDGGPAVRMAPPVFTPCPSGWREVVRPVDEAGSVELVVCDPYPASGRGGCEAGEAHLPGTAGCAPIGNACPTDDYAAVPTDVPVRFVDSAAAAGGDGTRTAPFATPGEALAAPQPDLFVALAKGVHGSRADIPDGVSVVGACAAETVVSVAMGGNSAIVTLADRARVADLSIRGPGTPGLRVASGDVRVEGVEIADVEFFGVNVQSAGLSADGLIVRDTQSSSRFGGQFGRAMDVTLGGSAEVRRAVVERARDLGLAVWGDGAALTLEDSVVADMLPRESDEMFGRGLQPQTTADVTVRRVVFDGNREISVGVSLNASLVLEDVVIRSTVPQLDRWGRGLNAQQDATLVGSRVWVDGSTEIGLAGIERATATLEDVAVTTVDMVGGGGGTCLGAYLGADVTVERFVLSGCALCGAHVAADSGLDLHDGVIAGSNVGACVQVPGYDNDRLSSEVVYIDNTVNLDAVDLPIPDVASGI